MAQDSVVFTNGSTSYPFLLERVHVSIKPFTGEVRRQTGFILRPDMLDAPWAITSFSGLGTSRATADQPDADNRIWEARNIQFHKGMFCLAAKAQTPTDITGAHLIVGMQEAIGKAFYFASTAADDRETIAYFVGSTSTWTSATATADWKATTSNAQFPVAGMADMVNGAGVQAVWALRTVAVNVAAAYHQLMSSTDGTTWTVIDHAAAASAPSGDTSTTAYGLIAIGTTLYTLIWSAGTITLRQSTNSGVTWTTTTATLASKNAPTSLFAHYDTTAGGILRPFFSTREGVWYWNGTTVNQFIDHKGDPQSNAGQSAVNWRVDGIQGSRVVTPQGRNINVTTWGAEGLPVTDNIAPTWRTQGLPSDRDGLVTTLAAAPNYLYAAIGGDSTATFAGIYVRVAQYEHPLGWFGPIYHLATVDRLIRCMLFSTLDDGIDRLHWAEDNGTAGDTNPRCMNYITRDPRNVASYEHAPSGQLIIPKNDRFLPELAKTWLKIVATGTGFSSNNKIGAVYYLSDSAPSKVSDSWTQDLGPISASAGSVNWPATPSGTGLSAKAEQLRFDLAGTSDDACYIESIIIYVEGHPVVKRVFAFDILLEAQGTQRTLQSIIDDLETITTAGTYSTMTYGEETTAIVVTPYWNGGKPFDYVNQPQGGGTGQRQTMVRTAHVEFVEL